MIIILIVGMPVSYTHLDVYKRQPVHRAARFLNILVEVAPHGNMRAQMPQPQLIEGFLVLLIERRPLAAIHQRCV